MPSYVYFQKQIIPLSEAKIGVMTNSFHYGNACFEGVRGNWNDKQGQVHLFRLREHYERMLKGCQLLKIDLPYTIDDLCRITVEMVEKCAFQEDLYVRPVAYKSSEALGVRLHDLEDDFFVFAFPWGPYLPEKVRCCVTSWRCAKEVPRAKINGLYVNNALAKSEAIENGFDEGIMLTSDGYVAEGTGENIFLIKNGKFITPAVHCSILEGITRDTVMKLAEDELGIETEERVIERSELYSAEECFLTGTAANITPVAEIDRRTIGNGEIGEVTKKLQQIYFDVIRGNDSKYVDWCTPIYKK